MPHDDVVGHWLKEAALAALFMLPTHLNPPSCEGGLVFAKSEIYPLEEVAVPLILTFRLHLIIISILILSYYLS